MYRTPSVPLLFYLACIFFCITCAFVCVFLHVLFCVKETDRSIATGHHSPETFTVYLITLRERERGLEKRGG